MNFRQVRKKIKTIGNVKKITNAMQMVSAVKMRKSQEIANEGRLYRNTLFSMLKQIAKNQPITFLERKEKKIKINKTLYIVVGSQKGLCGNYHLNLIKFLLKEVDFDNSSFIIIGNKLSQVLVRMKGDIIADFSDTLPLVDSVSSILSLAHEKYTENQFDEVKLIYTKFISTFRFEPTITKFLPLESDVVLKEQENLDNQVKEIEYLIEPSPKEVLEHLVKEVLLDILRTAVYDSEASEHSARMMAMKSATDNAEDIIYNLTLLRNKLRQESITNELLDMVSATSI